MPTLDPLRLAVPPMFQGASGARRGVRAPRCGPRRARASRGAPPRLLAISCSRTGNIFSGAFRCALVCPSRPAWRCSSRGAGGGVRAHTGRLPPASVPPGLALPPFRLSFSVPPPTRLSSPAPPFRQTEGLSAFRPPFSRDCLRGKLLRSVGCRRRSVLHHQHLSLTKCHFSLSFSLFVLICTRTIPFSFPSKGRRECVLYFSF